jgi:polyisoprenyl-phosphate glycosyltransferase
MQQVVILCPLFNDEASFNIFAAAIEKELQKIAEYKFYFLIVNDGSFTKPEVKTSIPSTVLHLHRNMGHQKAIAIGLSYAHHHLDFDKLIIMDADGEDQPEDVIKLLKASTENKIVFAQRISRQNGKRFKGFYSVYKTLFHLLTGKNISFGNFMLLSKEHVTKLVYLSEIWNHLAGAILKSKIPFTTIAAHRGKRYSGESKMNFTSLVLHGLGAIGVFIDVIATRLLIFSMIMIGISVLAILIIIAIRFFTDAAIPGWATAAFSSMLIVLLQSFLLSLFTIFLYLSSQSQRQFIPANHYEDYLASVEQL